MATNPLNEQDLADIKNALKDLDDADQQAQTAMRAGIDVSEQIKQIKDKRAQLLKIKQVYFPGQ